MSCWFYSTFSLHLCDVKRLFSSLMADTYTHLRQSISITGELHRPCFCEEKRFYLAGTKKLVCIPIREGVRRRKTFFPLQNMTKCYGTPSKKNTGLFGNFSQHGGRGIFPIPKTFVNLPSQVLKHVLHTGGCNIWSILSPKVHLIWSLCWEFFPWGGRGVPCSQK